MAYFGVSLMFELTESIAKGPIWIWLLVACIEYTVWTEPYFRNMTDAAVGAIWHPFATLRWIFHEIYSLNELYWPAVDTVVVFGVVMAFVAMTISSSEKLLKNCMLFSLLVFVSLNGLDKGFKEVVGIEGTLFKNLHGTSGLLVPTTKQYVHVNEMFKGCENLTEQRQSRQRPVDAFSKNATDSTHTDAGSVSHGSQQSINVNNIMHVFVKNVGEKIVDMVSLGQYSTSSADQAVKGKASAGESTKSKASADQAVKITVQET
jgi:hypothetical protein